MIGDSESPGLMILTFQEVFECLSRLSLERQYKVRLSYLEIYNEEVRDLLTTSSESLDVREDSMKGVTIAGLSEVMVTSPSDVINLIRNGNKRRTCEATMANETSSRSHAVLQIIVEYRDKASGADAEIISGKLSLIDLAGSERASTTKNRGIRLLEGANINRSLLALGNCINALYENAEKGSKLFIPYRDSKLTRLLKDSLGGNCRTVMIACVSPSYASFEDTHNTLSYANRAKNIKTNVQKNVVNVQYHISKYTTIISQLRQEINELRTQLHSKRNIPSVSIEKYLIVLGTHFQEEAKTRKSLHLIEQNLSQLEFVVYSRQLELAKIPENSDAFNYAKGEIETLKKTIENYDLQLRQEREKAIELEKKRQGIENSWVKLGVQEPYLSQLSIEMKKHALNISSLEIECKESQNKAAMEQKDQYIKLLEEQLRLRDTIIDSNQDLIRNSPERVISNLRSFDEISAQSMIIGKKGDYARSLPPISHSRIPRPKNVSPTSSVHSKGRESTNLPKISKEKKDKYKEGRNRRYAHRIRSYSTGSSDSEESNASSYVQSEKRAQIRRPPRVDRSSNASPKVRKPVYKL
jgi:kinesin family protein 18/19